MFPFEVVRSEASAAKNQRLYNLPNESTDVQDEHPESLQELKEQLSLFQDRIGEDIMAGNQEELSKARKRQLQELGYLE